MCSTVTLGEMVQMYSDVPISKLLAELINVVIAVWGIRVLLSKQNKLYGAARALRWIVVVTGVIVFDLWQHGLLAPLMGVSGLIISGFFLLFPDISFYLLKGIRN